MAQPVSQASMVHVTSDMDIMKVDLLFFQKISKHNFKKDIQEVTPMGPEPRHFFLFKTSQQLWLLEASKVLAKMGCGWQTD